MTRSSLEALRSSGALVVERPFAALARLATIAAGTLGCLIAIVLLARDAPWYIALPLDVPIIGALVVLVLFLARARREGSFRFAADERAAYFRDEDSGGLRELPWARCHGVSGAADGHGRQLRLAFERAEGDAWSRLCHARVFVRERDVEIVLLDVPDAGALRERLEALRAGPPERRVEPVSEAA